ncbi:hypothetical protein IU443_04665 [Nocardia farcinica]|uniref:ESX-1 secretion-associated protein n=1 Tax=Nocardia farcinica TaxID=37329 RepID=A0A0H5NJN4_NOCFR|nr:MULTISPECIES: hypothetical protein [Nocardia]AXK85075.1 hypothetical protein DXT66_05030 [Nocardia farcinica]MBA4855484.1 hypothetical protein [Nocardia farcinica]MBC9818177.1 hypothetical protein [Nocardia farcinica]MBF6067775.1 hypothetical protein [Nocardia farcinica]MBF6140846.1 hypothetical protein [Nocardia farcinica]
MDTLKLDPAAIAAYTAIADTVSEQLADAAAASAGAVDQARLEADLGLLGAGFAARFTAAVAEHTQALTTAGQLVAAYGRVLRDYDSAMRTGDAETAAALDKAGEELA